MEPRLLFSGTTDGPSVLSSIRVDEGMYVPGHQFGAQVSLNPWQGLEGLPVTLALSKDGIVGNADDVTLGTTNATTTSWPGVSFHFISANFSVTLPTSLADGTYNVVARSDDGSQVLGPSITVKTPKPGTDLQFVNGSMYPWLFPGIPGRANAAIRNAGTVTSGPWTLSAYLSKDKILGNGDDLLVASGTPSVGSTTLGPADMAYFSLEFDIASLNLSDGVYYPIYVIDPLNQVAETNETNNVLVADPVVAGPRLSDPGVVSVTAASRTDAGSTLSVDVVTRPIQGGEQNELYFELLASDGTAYRLGGTLAVPTTAGHVVLSVPDDVPAGQYQLRTMADINGMTTMAMVPNRDPATVGPTVWVGMDPPPAAAPIAPPQDDAAVTLSAGANGHLPLVVSNHKNRALRQTYNVSFYLSDDPTLSRDDRAFSRQQIAAQLRPNQSQALLASFQLPKGAHLGTHYLIAVADPANTPATSTKPLRRAASANRSHPGRLRLIVPIEVTRPNLKASVRSVKPAPNNPGMARVKVRVTNTGSEPLSSPVTFTVLSNDSQSPGALLTTTRPLTLETGHHKDLILLVPRPETGGFRIKVS